MHSTSRSKALADTLDWLEERRCAGPLRVRIQVHDGTIIEGSLEAATRREVRVSRSQEAPAVTLGVAEIALILVAKRRPLAPWSFRWETWFDYGSS
jgi:hypothetical protein